MMLKFKIGDSMTFARFYASSGMLLTVIAITIAVMACGSDGSTTAPVTGNTGNEIQLSGTIEIDGSSTVFPVSQAVAEEFRKVQPRVQVNVGVSGTGGGFKRFTVGETDISDASRPIKDKEAAEAKAKLLAETESN